MLGPVDDDDEGNDDLVGSPLVNIGRLGFSLAFEFLFLFPPLDTKDFVDADFPLCCDVRSRARARLVFTGIDDSNASPRSVMRRTSNDASKSV